MTTKLDLDAIPSDHDVRCAAESWWRWERQFTATYPECMGMLKHNHDVLQWICEGRCAEPDPNNPEEIARPGLRDSQKAAAAILELQDKEACLRGYNNEGDRIGGEGVPATDCALLAGKEPKL